MPSASPGHRPTKPAPAQPFCERSGAGAGRSEGGCLQDAAGGLLASAGGAGLLQTPVCHPEGPQHPAVHPSAAAQSTLAFDQPNCAHPEFESIPPGAALSLKEGPNCPLAVPKREGKPVPVLAPFLARALGRGSWQWDLLVPWVRASRLGCRTHPGTGEVAPLLGRAPEEGTGHRAGKTPQVTLLNCNLCI